MSVPGRTDKISEARGSTDNGQMPDVLPACMRYRKIYINFSYIITCIHTGSAFQITVGKKISLQVSTEKPLMTPRQRVRDIPVIAYMRNLLEIGVLCLHPHAPRCY